LEQLVYQGWLSWTTTVTQPFAARHPFVMNVPTRVQSGAVTPELLDNIPSTLKHLQFRRIYGKYNYLLSVVERNVRLEILNLFEIGDLEAIHLDKIIDTPIAQSLKVLRIRHLTYNIEANYGELISKIIPHLPNLEIFAFEVCALKDEPFMSTFVRCKNIRHFKFGFCSQVTRESVAKIALHGHLRSLELMPLAVFDIETLEQIVVGNPNLKLLLLPKETISDDIQKKLPYDPRISSLTK
jgi:hypothetical protein